MPTRHIRCWHAPTKGLIAVAVLVVLSCEPAEPKGRWTKGDEAIEFLGDGKAVLSGESGSMPMTYTLVEDGRVRLDSQQPLFGLSSALVFDFDPNEHTLTMTQADGSRMVFYESSGRLPKALIATWRQEHLETFWKDSVVFSACSSGCISNIIPEYTYLPDGNGLVISYPDMEGSKPQTFASWAWEDHLYIVWLSGIEAYRFKVRGDKLITDWTGYDTTYGGQSIDRSVATFTRRK